MDIWKFAIIAWLFKSRVDCRPDIGKFLKSFADNERKPTMFVFHGICWENHVKVDLMKELFETGIRVSNSMSVVPSFQDQTVLLLTDLNCPGADELMKNATRQQLQRLPYRWLVLADTLVQTSPLWDPFLVDSELVVATPLGSGYRMTEIYKTGPSGRTILTPRGEFHGVLTDVRPLRELFRRRRDVMGAPMTITNVIQQSNSSKYHLLQEDMLELQHDLMSKNGYTLAKVAFLMLNATPIATFTDSFGYIHNGKWTGIINELKENRADIGTNLGMTRVRLQGATFLDPMDNGRCRFIFRQPALSLTANIFSLPFSSGVWLATVMSSLVAGIAFYLSTRLVWEKDQEKGTVRDAYLLTVSAFSQQGCEVQPGNLSARIILWVLFTSFMALYAAYGANIVVLLQTPSTSINNLAQLARSKLTLGAADVNYNYFLFRTGSDPIRNEIVKKVIPDKGPKAFIEMNEGVEKIRKGLFAFHSIVEPVYRQIDKTFQEKEKCDLMEIDFIRYSSYHVPGNRKSPYLELLRVAFKRLRETGIKSAVNFRYEARKPSCKESVAQFSSVGVTELRPVLLLMAYGVALSVAVVAAEHLVYHANRLHRKRVAERVARTM